MNQYCQIPFKSIFIEGKVYELTRIPFDYFSTQGNIYNGKIIGNSSEQFTIKEYNKISKNEKEVIEKIRIGQREKIPKCQHIIQIIGILDLQHLQEQKLYVVMEQGKGNIAQLIDSTHLSFVQKIQIFQQMVKGVLELHNLGYFHRDLKPENFVYLDNEKNNYIIKLIDFGIATKDSQVRKTQQVGTFDYMAPEVFDIDGIYDHTADIWSLGIILYKLITLQNFIQAKNIKEYEEGRRNLNQEYINTKINKDLEKGFSELIISMLQIESSKRIQLQMLLFLIDQNLPIIQEQEERNQLELKEKRQQYIQQMNSNQAKIQTFIDNLNKKYFEIINTINIENQQKSLLLDKIKSTVEKYQEKMKQNLQKYQQIQQEQNRDIIITNCNLIIEESKQYLEHYNQEMENLTIQQSFLEQQVEIQKKKCLQYQHILDQAKNSFSQIIYDLLNQFIKYMNDQIDKIKELIPFCNSSQTQKLNDQIKKIEQKITTFFNKCNSQNQLNQQKYLGMNNQQIQLPDELQIELEKEKSETTKSVEQLISIIEQENYEIQLNTFNSDLTNQLDRFSNALSSHNFETADYYQQMIDKIKKLKEQLEQEIKTLEQFQESQTQNLELNIKLIKDMQNKNGYNIQQIVQLLRQQQSNIVQNGEKLNVLLKRVIEKKLEIQSSTMDFNVIQKFDDLKKEENILREQQKNIMMYKNQQSKNQQFEDFSKLFYNISELEKQIPKINQIKEFQQAYQTKQESYKKLYVLLNYIKIYHLTRYYQRIKNNAIQQQNNQQNCDENLFQKQHQSKLKIEKEEYIKKEKEAQDQFQKYENCFLQFQNLMDIEQMEKDRQIIQNDIEIVENYIKTKNEVKFRSKLKSQLILKEITQQKYSYQITEFAQMQLFYLILRGKK